MVVHWADNTVDPEMETQCAVCNDCGHRAELPYFLAQGPGPLACPECGSTDCLEEQSDAETATATAE